MCLIGKANNFTAKPIDPHKKNIHVVNASTGIALCGRDRDSIRDSWEEHHSVPAGHRLCSKCRKEDL